MPEAWHQYNCRSLLGASVAGQKNFSEAEPLLVSGYEGMRQRQATIPSGDRSALDEAGQGIVKLYQNWGKPEKAAEWQQRLQATELAGSRERR
jgi:hypothetical protein